jgi:hypothetical protein
MSKIIALTGRRAAALQKFLRSAGSVLELPFLATPGAFALLCCGPTRQVHRVTGSRGMGTGDLLRGSAIRPTESGRDSEFPGGRIAGILCTVDAGSDAPRELASTLEETRM